MKKVTMRLTETDIENTEKLTKQLSSRSKAATVSKALSIAIIIMDIIETGDDIMIRNDEMMSKLVITGI